jgi:hypothetical protein
LTRRWRWRLAVLAVLAAFGSAASAAKISIDAGADPDSRLEIRSITLPGGTEVALYVLTGKGLVVRIDSDELLADHVEVDLTNRVVRVIGPGTFTTGDEAVTGEDLIIDLRAESFVGDDVLIITDAIDVKGDRASRVPGLIRVAMGFFSPCTRCGQDLEDYAFEADRIEIYPGDRLVAYEVTVLIRGAQVLHLPLMVLPLAPPDRQPRLEYATGDAKNRARIAINWPYAAGADAYGDVGLRYYADVLPGGSAFGDALLGGSVLESYLGGSLDHRYYTERGKGEFLVDYTPGFLSYGPTGTAAPATGKQDPLFRVRFSNADEPVLGPPQTSLLFERDDTRRPRIWEGSYSTVRVEEGVRGTFSTQVFYDLDPSDGVSTPSYANRQVPLQTFTRLRVEPDAVPLDFGVLQVERLFLDLGAFQDRSNPLNRSAAVSPISTAGRVVESHALSLTPIDLWWGATLDGRTDFTGYYYDTAERQVEWLSDVTLQQSFGGVGNLGLTYTRAVREGETPFRFDLFPYRNRTDVRSRLRLDPLPWLRFEQSGGYVFVDDRDKAQVGWAPLDSTLTLLNDVDWITLTLKNSYDLKTPDPGTLDAALTLSARGALTASLNVEHSQDLLMTPDRLTGEPRDTSQTSVKASAGVTGIVDVSVSTAYRYSPPTPPAGQPADHFDDLEVKVTLGTLAHTDQTPGLAVTYARDLDLGRVSAFGVDAAATVGPLQFDASERIRLPTGQLASSKLRLAWPGVAAAQADGLLWLRTDWLGLPQPAPYSRPVAFTLEDAPLRDRPGWQVRYATLLDPSAAPAGADYGFRNSTLTGRVLLVDEVLGPARFSVDGFVELPWADDRQPSTYLRRANLTFGVDLFERVGLQGTVGYAGGYDYAAEAVSSGRLTLQQLAIMARPLDDLYVGAVLNEVWDLTGSDPAYPAFNLQPRFVVVWNRCCWALYGSWDSKSGAVSVTLTTPGATQGVGHVFDTGWIIPGREP